MLEVGTLSARLQVMEGTQEFGGTVEVWKAGRQAGRKEGRQVQARLEGGKVGGRWRECRASLPAMYYILIYNIMY